MLEVFDVLEGTVISVGNILWLTSLQVLRYLHSECQVLHRHISGGNVLYMGELSSNPLPNPQFVGVEETAPTDLLEQSRNPLPNPQPAAAGRTTPADLPLCFMKCERYVYMR